MQSCLLCFPFAKALFDISGQLRPGVVAMTSRRASSSSGAHDVEEDVPEVE